MKWVWNFIANYMPQNYLVLGIQGFLYINLNAPEEVIIEKYSIGKVVGRKTPNPAILHKR